MLGLRNSAFDLSPFYFIFIYSERKISKHVTSFFPLLLWCPHNLTTSIGFHICDWYPTCCYANSFIFTPAQLNSYSIRIFAKCKHWHFTIIKALSKFGAKCEKLFIQLIEETWFPPVYAYLASPARNTILYH